MPEGRREKTAKNLMYAWLNQMVMLLMNVAVRIVFVRVLTKEYLGVGGLFGNIISLLSMAELGIGTAIVYSLYEPLASGDEDKTGSLMKFYRKVYTVIGIVILTVGAMLTPHLAFFIKEMPDIPELRQIYLLFVCNASVSYFFSYKSALISADQKDYIVKKIKLIVTLVMYFLQIIVLFISGNYLLFLWIQIGSTIAQNVWYSWKADHMYPFLQNKMVSKLPEESLQKILKNTKALMFHKIGDVMVFSTDNLIISKFVGIVEVGLYSNYTLIQQALTSILAQIFSSMTASVGNLGVLESAERKYQVFKKVFFLNAWIYGFCSIAFLCMGQDFISLFFGDSFVMKTEILFLLVFNFYLVGMRKTSLTFRDAFGLFWQNRYMPIGEAAINLAVSLFLAGRYGVEGVLAGTVISTLSMPWWIEPYVVFRYGLQIEIRNYWKQYGIYSLITLIAALLCWKGCALISTQSNVIKMGSKALICLMVPNGIYWAAYRNNENYLYYQEFADRIRRAVMERRIIHKVCDWAAAAIIVLSLCIAYISKAYYDKIIGYAPMITCLVLVLLFFNHINVVERIKKKDKELILLVFAVALAGVNLILSKSGYGAIFNIMNFLLILFLADKIKLDKKIYGIIGLVCIAILGTWLGKGDKTFNTNLASLILFAVTGYGITALTVYLKTYGKDLWGKGVSLIVILGIILPMVFKLRARCVLVGIGVFVVFNYLVPKVVWRYKWVYRIAVLLLIGGSIAFPIWYVAFWKSGKENTIILGKNFFSGRNIVWDQFLTAFYKEPWTGIGSDFVSKIPDVAFTEVHNGLLHILVVHGILIFVIVFYFLAKRLFQIGEMAAEDIGRRQCTVMIAALAAVSVFENYFVLPFFNIFVLLLFAMGMAAEEGHIGEKR